MATRSYICAFILLSTLVAVCGQFGVETNRAPSFTAPSILVIKEDLPVGSVVGELAATDSDGDSISFSVSASGKTYFELVKVTESPGNARSNITLKSVPDYEVTEQFAVGFTVSDGVNSLPKNVIVYVVNTNDNSPVFSSQFYTRTVKENTAAGYSVVNVTATDPDYGPPNYYFDYKNGSYGETVAKFRIDDAKGEVTLTEALDYEDKPSYQLEVVARDIFGLNSTCIIVINVEDDEDQPPKFDRPTYAATIPESLAVSSEVLRVLAEDGDRGVQVKNKICYSFKNGTRLTYTYDDFSIDKNSGRIFVHKKLDRDQQEVIQKGGVFQYTVMAQEYDPGTECGTVTTALSNTTATVYITVEDVNDETPTFEQPTYIATVEEQLKGIPITITNANEIKVTDLDLGINGTFELYVTKDGQNYSAFSVTPKRSVNEAIVIVRVANETAVDFEKTRNVTFQIVARETETVDRRSSNSTIILTVLDRNDNAPVFAKTSYTAYIPENSMTGDSVIQITATDEDSTSNYANITYRLQGGSNSFQISPATGLVTVSCGSRKECERNLDYEKTNAFYMTVEATDGGGLKGITQLEVILNDTNDNRPTFSQSSYSGVVKEDSTTFEREITVRATDKDSEDNGRVYYNITGGDPEGKFTINSTSGLISLTSVLDYEAMNASSDGFFHLQVMATDWGFPALSSVVQVDIEVVDENDNDPEFLEKIYTANILENATTDDFVLQVNATDRDKPGDPNSIIIYSIESGGMDRFEVERDTGIIKVENGARFDRETLDVYNLTILALDKGTPQRSASCYAIIHIKDVNDELPRFSMSEATATVSENAPVGHIVYTYNATDRDENDHLKYTLVSDGSMNWFGIHSNNGSVYVNNTLDRETRNDVTVVVKVEDLNAFQPKIQTATASLEITISDYNDNAPEFINSPTANVTVNNTTNPVQYTYSVKVNESATTGKQGSRVITLRATDKDLNQQLQYSIQSNSETFEVDPNTGDVTLKKLLDRENATRQTFTAIVVDVPKINTGPSLSSTATVTVTVMDTNDNDPQWIPSMIRSARVPENATTGTEVLTVNATDKDEGNYGNVTYSIKSGSNGKFHIDPNTGMISVAAALDRENTTDFTLMIEAKDNLGVAPSRKIQTEVTIEITDINDNSPQFAKTLYTFKVEEDKDNTTSVGAVTATDGDKVGTPNSMISYSVVPGSGNGTQLFTVIGNPGDIRPLRSLTGNLGIYSMSILAQDMGTPSRNGTTQLKIEVTDVNDHKPVFVSPLRPVSVNESFTGEVLVVNATDGDLGDNGRVNYRLINNTDRYDLSYQTFEINRTSGVLRTRKTLDRETTKKYWVGVEAYDLAPVAKRLSDQMEIVVNILDINDHEPTFDRENYPLSGITRYVKENLTSALVVRNLVATDEDEDAVICYWLIEGNMELFELTNSNSKANISLRRGIKLDREETSSYRLVVQASNDCSNEPTMSQPDAQVTIIVQVEDINDNPPKFSKSEFTAGVTKDDVKPEDVVLELKNEVFDPDIGNNSKVQFYMVPGSMNISSDLKQRLKERIPFLVELNGQVKSDMQFDSDMSGNVDFNVYVNDSGGFHDKTKVSIYLIGDDQQIQIIVPGSPDDNRHIENELEEYLSNITGAIIDVDARKAYEAPDSGSLQGKKTAFYVHAVEKQTNKVLSAKDFEKLLENQLDKLNAFYKRFNVYDVIINTPEEVKTEGLAEPLRMALLITALVLLLLLLLLIGMFFTARRKYKRKLKAATAYAYNTNDNGLSHVDLVPGTNLHTFEGTNPLFGQQMENNWPDSEEVDADSHSESVDSESDSNSLDDNVIEAKEVIKGYDNKAMTIDLYDDFETNISPAQVAKSDMFLQAALNEHDANTKTGQNDLNHTSDHTPYQEGYMRFDPNEGTVVINGMQTTDI